MDHAAVRHRYRDVGQLHLDRPTPIPLPDSGLKSKGVEVSPSPPCVAFMDASAWSTYGAERSQPVAVLPQPDRRIAVYQDNNARTQNGHIRNDTRDVSRRIFTACNSPICRRNCVASDRACTRVTPRNLHGKEGVDGSSPSEGSAKAQHNALFHFGSTCRLSNVGGRLEHCQPAVPGTPARAVSLPAAPPRSAPQ